MTRIIESSKCENVIKNSEEFKHMKFLSDEQNKNNAAGAYQPSSPKKNDSSKFVIKIRKRTEEEICSTFCKKLSDIDLAFETKECLQHIEDLLDEVPEEFRNIPLSRLCVRDPDDDPSFGSMKSLSSSMSYQDIAQHLCSLRVEYIMKLARPILMKLMQHPNNANKLFSQPVDPVLEGIPQYFEKLKQLNSSPIDLGSIRSLLQRIGTHYRSLEKCFEDMLRVFENALKFNAPSHLVHKMALTMRQELKTEMTSLYDKCLKEIERKKNHTCSFCCGYECHLCGEKCLKFDPVVHVCYGSCGQKIKKNSVYYLSSDCSSVWCQKCYNNLPPVIVNSDRVSPLVKRDLLKRRSDEEVAEPWVECDTCGFWVHQICALYYDFNLSSESDPTTEDNNNSNSNNNVTFQCPMCTLERHKKIDFKNVSIIPEQVVHHQQFRSETQIDSLRMDEDNNNNNDINATDFENVTVTDSGEDSVSNISTERSVFRVYDNMEDDTPSHEDNEQQQQQSVHANVSISDDSESEKNTWKASSLPRSHLSDFLEEMVKSLLKSSSLDDVVDTITIRMVSNRDHKFDVPKHIIENMMTADGECVPDQLAYRQKCILLFQKIGGVDVCLFCLYVQEFDESCPPPNKSTIYIAYLDSVDYFRPMEARTSVYQEIMVGYLKWAQIRGFKQGHIWSCPPQRGDNFIFNIHPHHQRTPARERLNSWYNAILLRAAKLNIISELDTLWDQYFSLYCSREEAHPRQAAKNSLVGSGKINNFTRKYNNKKGDDNNNKSNSSIDVKKNINSSEKDIIPICPPVFEGDLWVLESYRVSRSIQNLCKGSDGGDIAVNQRKCREVMRHLTNKHIAAAFLAPVDAEDLCIPTYHTVVKEPMDLGTVKDKLRVGSYENILQFVMDVRLTFSNAMLFNPPEHIIHINSMKLLSDFNKSMVEMIKEFAGEVVDENNLDQYVSMYPLGPNSQNTIGGNRPSALQITGSKDSCYVDKNNNLDSCRSNDETYNNNEVTPLSTTSNSCESSFDYNDDNNNNSNNNNDDEQLDSEAINSNLKLKKRKLSRVVSEECTVEKKLFKPEGFAGQPLERQSSLDTFHSNNNHNHHSDFEHRIDRTLYSSQKNPVPEDSNHLFCAREHNNNHQSKRFEKPVLTSKALTAMMSDLSKGVKRLSDDLFVIKFAEYRGDDNALVVDYRNSSLNNNNNNNDETNLNPHDDMEEPIDIKEQQQQQQSTDSIQYIRGKLHMGRAAAYLKKAAKNKLPHESLPPSVIQLIQKLRNKQQNGVNNNNNNNNNVTSDPDDVIVSPFVDTRHTFLEMSQFRHYQFDSLRRAKFSSLMLLFHLFHPDDKKTRPTCQMCQNSLQNIRWHCDQCPNYDICQSCFDNTNSNNNNNNNNSNDNSSNNNDNNNNNNNDSINKKSESSHPHPHDLTPFRVTFL